MNSTIIQRAALYFALICITSTSCKKSEVRDLEKAGSKLIGTWQVSEINVHITDTMGNLLQDSSTINQGTVTFAKGDATKLGIAYFDHADFAGPCAVAELVLYFRNVDAGYGRQRLVADL
jgi:hypothetical protein